MRLIPRDGLAVAVVVALAVLGFNSRSPGMPYVWSKRLCGPTNISGAQLTLGTVPAGRVWVAKTIMAMNDGNSVTARILVGVGSLGVVANRMVTFDIGPKSWRVENLSLVFAAGESVTALASLGPGIVNMTISGYELDSS